jgi:hypothetical protein
MYPLRLVKVLIDSLPQAAGQAADAQQYVWELAAKHAGIPDSEVRILSIEPLVLLVGEDWVVQQLSATELLVRQWEWDDDEFARQALAADAIDYDGLEPEMYELEEARSDEKDDDE